MSTTPVSHQSSTTKVEYGPNTTTTTTVSKTTREYKYLSKTGEEPKIENHYSFESSKNFNALPSGGSKFTANLNDLDNLLEHLNSVRRSTTPSGHNNSALSKTVATTTKSSTSSSNVRDRSDSLELNKLISDHERNLKHPNEALLKGQEVKPITMTKYYYESHTKEVRPSKSQSGPQQVVYNRPKSTTSKATNELEDLMSMLNDFKTKDKTGSSAVTSHSHIERTSEYGRVSKPKPVSPTPARKTPPPVRKTPTPQPTLEVVLDNLESDMSKQGVDTSSKGYCAACNKSVVGKAATALGKIWHPEHFTCVHCGNELGTKNFFERDGEPYCENDYHKLFSPRCAYCNASILDICVTALDKTWHKEHFFCAHCGKQFDEDGFHEKDGKPYCSRDYFDLFAPKCSGCNNAITDNYISALNGQWHPDCFVCRDCRCPFIGGSFFDYEGQPYCETHYHAKRGSLCAGCHQPIMGRCITAMFRKFHPEHFVCSFCLKQLNKGTFKEQNDKPYCHPCFDKLFG